MDAMRRGRIRAAVFAAVVLASSAGAESPLGPVFRVIGVADGLPDSRVEAVVQDVHGYVWIATQSGLVRLEGDRIHVLGTDPDLPDPLPGRNIMALHAHSDGMVWAAVAGQGLVEIGPDLARRRQLALESDGGILPHDNVWSLAEDCDGNLWIAYMQGGVGRFDPHSGHYRHFDQDESAGLIDRGFQLKLSVDSRCRVWLAQSEAVSVLDPERDSVFRRIVERDAGPIITSVGEALGDVYYSQGPDLFSLGPVDTPASVQSERVLSASRVIVGFEPDEGTGRILIGSYDGLYRFHPESGTHEAMRAIPGLGDGLPASSLLSPLVDSEGGVWVPVPRHGVAYLSPGHVAFERFQHVPGFDGGIGIDEVTAVGHGPSDDQLWLGSMRRGVQILDVASGSAVWLHERYDNDELAVDEAVIDLHVDRDRAFIVRHSAVARLDTRSGKMDILLRRDQVDDGTFGFVRPDGPDHLLVATMDAGLIRLDLATGEREQFHPGGEGRHWLPESEVVMVERDAGGRLWVGGENGIYRLGESGFERAVELERPPLVSATATEDGLWAATEVALHFWRWRGGDLESAESWSLPGRLPPGRVHAIHPVADNAVWLVRSSGLARLDPESGTLRHYTRADGMAATEFIRRASTRLADGRLALGADRGLVLVDPWKARISAPPPPVHIKAVRAGTRRIDVTPGARPTIELAHDDNNLQVEFIALSYVSVSQNRYRLRLTGWDEDWLELVGHNRHHYSNLPSGDYRLEVRAAAADGPWNEQGDSLEFRIAPPPWRTPWALAGYLLFGAAGAGLGWRGLRNARRRQREIRAARQKSALAEEQRQVIERIHRSLEPLELAEAIAGELRAVVGGTRAIFGYLHEEFPATLVTVGTDESPPSRDHWRRALAGADGHRRLDVELEADEATVARVLIECDHEIPGFRERLELLRQVAGHALHNALLLQRVRALAERAEQASSAKSEFLATMSHEIRTPLHGVLGMVELLYETQADPGHQDIFDTLRHSGMQLQRIIDDVLDISRIEAGRLSLDEQPFELNATLEQVIDLHASNAARKGLDLRLRLVADLPLIAIGDAGRISQVLGNLLSNAVKFTDQGGIEVSAERDRHGQLLLVVADSGPGIDPDDRDRLFEPFSQLDSSITRSHSGSGLGLAICRRLVDAMGGQLFMLEPCHGGSRFAVRLPVFDMVRDASELPSSRLLEGFRVAVAADAPTRRVAMRLMRRWQVDWVDALRQPPGPCSLLLIESRLQDRELESRLAAWRQQAEACAMLQSPYQGMGPFQSDTRHEHHVLRWPLVESRFVGLLLDLALNRGSGSGD